jgi:hypothetical protein
MRDYVSFVREEARLIILRLLSEQTGGVLNSSLLQAGLEGWGIHKTREWVHGELHHLGELGAVLVSSQAGILIATLTQRGADHVERRIVLDGVKRPSLPGG